MDKLKMIPDHEYIFGCLFVVANKLDKLMERELKEFDVTSKQWFLSMVVNSLFEKPPTIKEAAFEMGSSHQNVKQVALKLQEKGLMELVKDKEDARATRLVLGEKNSQFWQQTNPKGEAFMKEVFANITVEEISIVRTFIEKIMENLYEMEDEKKE